MKTTTTTEAKLNLTLAATGVLKACCTAQRAIDGHATKTSDLILNLFKECKNSVEFKLACTAAETEYKAKCTKAGKTDKLPRCWSQAKSDLIGADKAGVKVMEVASVSQAKREKIVATKAKKEADKQHANAGKQDEDTSHTSSTSNKFIQLGEQLGELSESTREAMLDSFLAMVKRAQDATDETFNAAMGDVQYKAAKEVTDVAKSA